MANDDLKKWAIRVAGSILRREGAALATAAQYGDQALMEANSTELASAMTTALMDAFRQGQETPRLRGRRPL